MAKGYWGWHFQTSRCCKAGPKQKFVCAACDHVTKAPWEAQPVCPRCRKPMTAMGDKWRPGKRGRRVIPERTVHRLSSPGEQLLARLLRE